MTIDLSEPLAARLRDLADQQGQDPASLVEEAVRRYLEDATITDVNPAYVGAAQERLARELSDLPPWTDQPETADNEAR